MGTVLIALLLPLQIPSAEETGPKIADIKSFDGTVTVSGERSGTRSPTKVGRRFRNVSLFDEDRVETAPEALCEVLFPDDSTVTLKAGSAIQILQKELPTATPDGKTIGRRIRLLVGDMVTQVVPNKQVQTDFETPAGTAAVRGTGIVFHVDPDTGAVDVRVVSHGPVDFVNEANQLLVSLSEGQSARFTFDPTTGAIEAAVIADAGTFVVARFGGADVRMNGADQVRVEVRDGRIQAQTVGGEMELRGPEGEWRALERNFNADLDPDFKAMRFDPEARTAGGFRPSPEMLFAEAFVLDAQGALLPPPDFLRADLIGKDLDEGLSLQSHRVFHTLETGFDLINHIFEDDKSIQFGKYDSRLFEERADRVRLHDLVHSQSRLFPLAVESVRDMHDRWHNPGFTQARGDGHPRHADFHAGDPLWSLDPWGSDLQSLVEQSDRGVLDRHLLGHVLIGRVHLQWHVHEDDQPPQQYSYFHPQIHSAVDTLHGSLHGGDLHGFIHEYVNTLHDGWHQSIGADGTCGMPADFSGGECHHAHEHLHEQLNVFHDHLHEAFDVGK